MNNTPIKSIFVLCLFGLLSSCQDDIINEIYNDSPIDEKFTKSISPIIDFDTDWEKFEALTTKTGLEIKLPWYRDITGPVSSISDEYTLDIKKEDGWELVCNTINNHDARVNYILFYNRLTGQLKGFYYLESPSINNTGLWQLSFSKKNSILNSNLDFAYPANSDIHVKDIQVAGINTSTSKGFSYGWNCFVADLNYDITNIGQLLNINAYNSSTQKILLEGGFSSNTEGLLITRTSTNILQSMVNQAAKSSGLSVKNWILDEKKGGKYIKLGKLTKAFASISSGGVSSVINAGLSSVFSSIIGRANKTHYSEQKLTLSTHGKVELEGTISSLDNGLIPPLSSIDFSKTSVNYCLGVWNVKDIPTITFDRYSQVIPTVESDWVVRCEVEIFTPRYSVNYDVDINPILLKEPNPIVSGYKVSHELVKYEKYLGDNLPGKKGGETGTVLPKNYIYDDTSSDNPYPTIIAKEQLRFSFLYPGNSNMFQWDWSNSIHRIKEDHVLRVNLELYTNMHGKQDTIYFTRSYIPKHIYKTN